MITPRLTFALLTLTSFALCARAETPALSVPPGASTRILAPELSISPDHSDWSYRCGEPVTFNVSLSSDGAPLRGATVAYRYGPEGLMADELINDTSAEMSAVQRGFIVIQDDGHCAISAGTMRDPGFLRCVVTFDCAGKTYRALATAGYEPQNIRPTQTEPADFDEFWAKGLAQLAKVPIEPQLTLLPDRCTSMVDVYQVRLQNVPLAGSSRPTYLFGILCEPKGPGPFPAILYVPGAGMHAYQGQLEMAEHGVITLEIGIHGIPVNMGTEFYGYIGSGIAAYYYLNNLDDRDRIYYRHVYLGCVRANDFLVQRRKFDGRNLIVTGASQGGQLSITTGSLDSRVKGLAVGFPAYSDVSGDLHGRAGGWPHMFRRDALQNRTAAKVLATSYYDTVNFGRRLKVPGFYVWGFNDETSPPTSMFAVYNIITAPKRLALLLDSGHAMYPEEANETNQWLLGFLGLK